MGMSIEEKCYLYGSCKCQTAGCVVRPDNGCPVYRYFKDLIVKDYENRLKADIVAILDKIYADIQKLRGCSCSCSDGIIDDIEDILDKYREREVEE